MESDEQLSEEAKVWANQNRKQFAKRFLSEVEPEIFEQTVSLFMAGSPGAGKTEFSKRLLETLLPDYQKYIVRIDPDEIRQQLPQYVAGKAERFQAAVSILVERIHDQALKEKKSFLLDGTLSNLPKARNNIQRSLNKQRFVQIFYIYQDPLVAWELTQKREAVEGRNIPKESFVEQYFLSQENVTILKQEYKENIQVEFFSRNTKTGRYDFVTNVTKIDNMIDSRYSRDTLLQAL